MAAPGALLLIAVGTPSSAHRLDEYLQATTLSVEKGRIHARIRLTPGVAVFPAVLASIDGDADGVISKAEAAVYGERVIRDLSLTIDGEPVRLRLVSSSAGRALEMREGRGDIQLEADADVPGGGPVRRLDFENHHESRIAAYLVNCLVPSDPDIRITAQNRTFDQSFYRLDYVEAGGRGGPLPVARGPTVGGWLGSAALVLVARVTWLGLRGARHPGFPSAGPEAHASRLNTEP